MKRKRFTRLIACALLLCLIPGILAFPVSAKYFEDVYPGMLAREFFDAINYVSDNNIMNGTEPTRFSPYENVTRGMFVTILYRYSGSTQRYSSSFSDVPSSQYYYYAVGWASHHGIVNGTTPTTFEPESPLTREQMTVILYRYAKSYEGRTFNASSFASITTHPDYSSVSSYAVESIRWAKTYHLIRLTTDTSYINATSNINRAYVALAIANYAKNVAGFTKNDRFSFTNNDFSSTYRINSTAKNYLFNCIDQYYNIQVTKTQAAQAIINMIIGTKYEGSCQGYSFSLLFDKLGKIDFNKNCGKSADTMNAVSVPKNNSSSIESVINFYQFAQVALNEANPNRFSATDTSGLQKLYNQFKKQGALPFSFSYSTKFASYGHCIIITDIKKVSNTNYTVKVIDPNSLNNYNPLEGTLWINNNNVYFGQVQLDGYSFYDKDHLNLYDKFDFDGDYNNLTNRLGQSTNTNSMTESTTQSRSQYNLQDSDVNANDATIVVSASQFEIKNAAGEVLTFDGQNYGGSMDVLSESRIFNSQDSLCTLIITVKASELFEYYNLADCDSLFGILYSGNCGRISGQGIHSVHYDLSENTICAQGENMLYSALLSIDAPDYDYFYVQGECSRTVTISENGSQIHAEGLIGVQECGFSTIQDYVGETISLEFGELSTFDLSNIQEGTIQFSTDGSTSNNSSIPITRFSEDS